MRRLAIPAQLFTDGDASFDLLSHIAEQLQFTDIEEVMVIMEPGSSNETNAEDEPDSGNTVLGVKEKLEAGKLTRWHDCHGWIGSCLHMHYFLRHLVFLKCCAVRKVYPQAEIDTLGFCQSELWAENHLIHDGKCVGFDQKTENLVTPEVEKLFKCPRIRIMGITRKPYEG